MLRSFHKFLLARLDSAKATLFLTASVCSVLLYSVMAFVFWLEYHHCRSNKETMVDAVRKAGFGLEKFEASTDSCAFMSLLSLLFLPLDALASYTCLLLSRKMREASRIPKDVYILAQYTIYYISVVLLSVVMPDASFAALLNSGSLDTALSPLYLMVSCHFYIQASYGLALFTLFNEVHYCTSIFYSLWFLDSKSIETSFTQSSYLTKKFVDQIVRACKLLDIDPEHIHVVDDDSRSLVVRQSILEGTIRIPVKAITFLQEEALLAEVLAKLFDLHNLSPVKARSCIFLIKSLMIFAYGLLAYSTYLRSSHDARIELLGAWKIIRILHLPSVVLLNYLLRHFERLSDDFVLRQGFRDNIAKLLSKMDQDEERACSPHYTGIIGILSPAASLVTRMERIQRPEWIG